MTAAPTPEPEPAEACGMFDYGCKTAQGIGDAVAAGADDAVTNLAEKVSTGLGDVVKSLGTLWVNVNTPNLTGSGGGAETVAFIRDSLAPYMLAAAVVSVMIGAARMTWDHRGALGLDLLKSLVTLVVVAGAGVPAIFLAVVAADGFSKWIIEQSTDGTDFGTNMTVLLALSGGASPLGALLVIVLGLVAIIASFVQIMLMVARAAMLVILAGVLPMTASFTSTDVGKVWLRKSIGWTVAFILYKPAAAVVYATAFRLTGAEVFGDDGSGLISLAVGLMLMILALVALPALMRFVAPMVSQLSSGGGGSGLGLAAAATLPTGAASIVKMTRGGGGGSGSSSGQPSGAPSTPGPTGGSGQPGGGGSPGPVGGPGPAGGAGPAGSAAASSAPAAGGGAAGAGAGAGAGAAGAGAGAGAGAAAGPVGMAAGAAVGTAASGVVNLTKAAGGAARRTANEATGAGPDGSA